MAPIVTPTAIHHVRLTVTDIARSKAFYSQLFGDETAFDFSDKVDEPGVRDDPAQLYGGVGWAIGDQLLGLRPVAKSGDSFDSTRVGLDHISFQVGSEDELRAAQQRLEDAGITNGGVEFLDATSMLIRTKFQLQVPVLRLLPSPAYQIRPFPCPKSLGRG